MLMQKGIINTYPMNRTYIPVQIMPTEQNKALQGQNSEKRRCVHILTHLCNFI